MILKKIKERAQRIFPHHCRCYYSAVSEWLKITSIYASTNEQFVWIHIEVVNRYKNVSNTRIPNFYTTKGDQRRFSPEEQVFEIHGQVDVKF